MVINKGTSDMINGLVRAKASTRKGVSNCVYCALSLVSPPKPSGWYRTYIE